MSTDPKDDALETASANGSVATASKDLKEEINIIQDLGDVVYSGSEAETSKDLWSEHWEKVGASTQSLVDEHIKPKWESFQKGTAENWTNLQKGTEENWKNLQTGTVEGWNNLQKGTTDNLNYLQTGTAENIDYIQKGTVENWNTVQKGTVEGWTHVQKGTVENWTNMQKGVAEGVQNSQKFVSGIQENSQRAFDENVKPTLQNIQTGTQSTLQNIQTKTAEGYQAHVQPQVEKAQAFHNNYQSCYMGTAPDLFPLVHKSGENLFYVFLEATLRAFGKVVFCDNPITGLFLWIAMCVGADKWFVPICALTSTVAQIYLAYYLETHTLTQLRTGNIAVNAVLVGTGCATFLNMSDSTLGWMGYLLLSTVILPPMTLLVQLHCTKNWFSSIPPLLIPYNIVMICLLMASVVWDRSLVIPGYKELNEDAAEADFHPILATLNGVSTIFLIPSGGWPTALCMLVGTLLCSPMLTAGLFVGSATATLLHFVSSTTDMSVLNQGIVGYNAALTVAALMYYFEGSWTLLIVGAFVVVLCEVLEAAGSALFWDALSLPITLTLGFCLSTMLVFFLESEESCSRYGPLHRIPTEDLSIPEDYRAIPNLEDDNEVTNEATPLMAADASSIVEEVQEQEDV